MNFEALIVLITGIIFAAVSAGLWVRWTIKGGAASGPDQGAWIHALEFGSRRLLSSLLPGAADRWFRWGLQAHYPAQALACFEEAARLGSADAFFELGLYFEEGGMGPGGSGVAADYFQRAAEMGHSEAAFRLAESLRWGIGPSRKPREALRWYLRSGHRGFGPAMAWLAEAYSKGDGVDRDPTEANRWQDRAASLSVMSGLRHSIIAGSHVSKDPLVRAGHEVRAGWERGMDFLGKKPAFHVFNRFTAWIGIVLLGLGAVTALLLAFIGPAALVAVSTLPWVVLLHFKLRRSSRWGRGFLRMEASAKEGDPEACFRLGVAFMEGRHPLPRDPIAGREWIRKSAEAGHADAMFHMGELLSWNIAGPRDPGASEVWLQRAAGAGHIGARVRLERMVPQVETKGSEDSK